MIRYALVVNPMSGKGGALRRAETLAELLRERAHVEILPTRSRGDAVTLASACVGHFDRVMAVGGDGTLNEVLNGLMHAKLAPERLPALGFYPSGTANVATKAFGLSTDPRQVAATLERGEFVPMDVGRVTHAGGERCFLLWFGAGWDAVVIDALNTERAGTMGVSGLIGHVPRVVSAMARYGEPAISSELDGQPFGRHSSVIVANVGPIAFGGTITEAADPSDGVFDVVGVPQGTVIAFIGMGIRILVSSLTNAGGVGHATGGCCRLEAEGTVPFQLDGEPVGVLPATVRLVPRAVRLLVS